MPAFREPLFDDLLARAAAEPDINKRDLFLRAALREATKPGGADNLETTYVLLALCYAEALQFFRAEAALVLASQTHSAEVPPSEQWHEARQWISSMKKKSSVQRCPSCTAKGDRDAAACPRCSSPFNSFPAIAPASDGELVVLGVADDMTEAREDRGPQR